MHVKARMTAFSGLLLALSVVCMALGSVIETNTLFLLAAASYFVGIIIREFGMKAGVAFYLADILLGFLVTPNKFYVISFAAMGFYILAAEGSWRFLGKSSEKMQKSWIFWVMKYVVFNLMYIPMVLIFQELLFMKELDCFWLFWQQDRWESGFMTGLMNMFRFIYGISSGESC